MPILSALFGVEFSLVLSDLSHKGDLDPDIGREPLGMWFLRKLKRNQGIGSKVQAMGLPCKYLIIHGLRDFIAHTCTIKVQTLFHYHSGS